MGPFHSLVPVPIIDVYGPGNVRLKRTVLSVKPLSIYMVGTILSLTLRKPFMILECINLADRNTVDENPILFKGFLVMKCMAKWKASTRRAYLRKISNFNILIQSESEWLVGYEIIYMKISEGYKILSCFNIIVLKATLTGG